MRRTTAVLGALALVVSGLTLTTTSGPAAATEAGIPPSSAASVYFGPCADPTLQRFGAECGTVRVPLDHDRPGGPTIRLAISRVRHTVPDAQFQGVVLVNPGGPGGSGLVLSVLQGFVPHGAGQAYDWIGFDPRGVGDSEPSLSCVPGYFGPDRPDYVPLTAAIEQRQLDRAAHYADACGKAGGALLDHITTADSAKDMESIRQALGQRQINYYGFSYGTYLAQVYATLFPHRLRRAVLDSNVDPRTVWYQANLDQDVAFDRNAGIFFDWVARHDSTYHLGTTRRAVENRYYSEQDLLRRAPAGGVVGPDEWSDVFVGVGYSLSLWPRTAQLFADWIRTGEPQPLIDAYRRADAVGDDNGFAVYNAVQCTDVPYPADDAQVRADAVDLYRTRPFLTWNNVWFNAPCLTWPAAAHRPVQVDGAAAPPVLLIGGTLDAATPYAGSLEVRSRFPRSRLVSIVGDTTHGDSLNGNACVDDTIAAYLATGKLPVRKDGRQADRACATLPQPEPEAAGSATEQGAGPLRVHGVARQDLPVGRR